MISCTRHTFPVQWYSVLQSTTPVLQSTTPYYKVLLQYYSVLQSTTPVQRTTPVLQSTTRVLQTTKYYSSTTPYYSSTTPYYKELLQYYKVLLRTTNYKVLLQYYSVLLQYYSSTTPYYKVLLQYYSNTTLYYKVLLRPLKPRQTDVLPVLLRTTPVLQKLPKRAFRAMLPTICTEKASKMLVSCEASSKFHRTSFQNERFAQCFRQFSQKKLPKWSFRARLPPNFSASKTSVSRDASNNFHQKFAFRYSFAQSTHRFLREGSSAESKMCLALQRRAFPNVTMCVSPQRRAQKCMNLSTANRPASRTQKCDVLLQFWAIDTTFLLRGSTESKWNLRFATVLGDRHHVFTERVAAEKMKFAFRYSFGRSTPRFYREGCPRLKWNLRFATVLGDRHHVFTERVDREQMKFAFRYTLGIGYWL